MFVVQAADRLHPWISGVFSSREAAGAYIALIPEDHRPRHAVVELAGFRYPFYVCEDAGGFRFLTEAEFIEELNRYATDQRQDDEDWCYTNVYRLAGDWQPKRPGADCMGGLPHHHVTNATLAQVERDGFDSLWR